MNIPSLMLRILVLKSLFIYYIYELNDILKLSHQTKKIDTIRTEAYITDYS
jgi:hypothetical protein